MRDLLIKKASNVTQAYTTDAVIENDRYCVVARALVADDKLDKFEKKLNNLSTRTPHKLSAKKVLVRVTI